MIVDDRWKWGHFAGGGKAIMKGADMVQVKAPVTGWHDVSREQALHFAVTMVKGAWCGTSKALEYINGHCLRGIKFTVEDIQHGRDI